MESRGSSTRSAARATFSAPKRVPIRWRLAGGSALLTLVILCGFAGAVGTLTAQRIHSTSTTRSAARPTACATGSIVQHEPAQRGLRRQPRARTRSAARPTRRSASSTATGQVIKRVRRRAGAGSARRRSAARSSCAATAIENRRVPVTANIDDHFVGACYMQYARPLADVRRRSTACASSCSSACSAAPGSRCSPACGSRTRAMAPIAALTATAREIERTRDPARRVPDDGGRRRGRRAGAHARRHARRARRGAHGDGGRAAAPARVRRRRLARAAHAADERARQPRAAGRDARRRARRGGAAPRCAPRRRMRRLVADLLLLARADAERQAPQRARPTSARSSSRPRASSSAVADGHELHVDADHAIVDGARDELHRLALNLMENARPPHAAGHDDPRRRGARERQRGASPSRTTAPASTAELRDRVFERFVRGAGDSGGSFGLGLSIVRAVAESHGGTVRVESPTTTGASIARGTRFVVTLPAATRRAGRDRLDSRPRRRPAAPSAAARRRS